MKTAPRNQPQKKHAGQCADGKFMYGTTNEKDENENTLYMAHNHGAIGTIHGGIHFQLIILAPSYCTYRCRDRHETNFVVCCLAFFIKYTRRR